MDESVERISVCSSNIAKCVGKTARLIGRVIQPGQPGPQAKVQVYAGPGNPVTVTLNLDSRIENLVEFLGTVTSATTMRADSYHTFPDELTEKFDLETYCEAINYTSVYDNPWNEGLA